VVTSDPSEMDLLKRAIGGDRDATGLVLWMHYDRLHRHVATQIPEFLSRVIDPDDVLEEAFVRVWQHIREFQIQGPDSFYVWLKTTSQRVLLDKIRAHRALKRGAGRTPAEASPKQDSSVESLLDLVAVDFATPSQSAMRREAEQVLHVAIAGLPEHYRQAVDLRYLKGRLVADEAARMGRTEGAVQMLCQRALKRLRDELGNAKLKRQGPRPLRTWKTI
jgi:RNA polymerase sigma-70 factor, ECF subfamily